MTNDLYEPLASKLRPKTLADYVGQAHLLGEGKFLRKLIESDRLQSMILWGPPGSGKTTLANIIANMTDSEFITFSAVTSGIKEVRAVMAETDMALLMGRKRIIFIDEIHRFNKAQQDAFLPFVEKGSIILIGATTENPSFEVNSALISRCKVFVLYQLSPDDIHNLLKKALILFEEEQKVRIVIDREDLFAIAIFSNGDARVALNILEMVLNSADRSSDNINDDNINIIMVKRDLIEQCTNRKLSLYDKKGEEHYNLISALHKSMRNSDPQAATYWLARMLEAGEDPLYIARRVVRFASEDIGLAASSALNITVAAYQACHFIGMPECGVILNHAVIYCALAAKSNSVYKAYGKAAEDIQRFPNEPVPKIIRNAPTRLMKELGYGDGYQYAHDYEDKVTSMQCLPDNLVGRVYYEPTDEGQEKMFKERLHHLENIKKS